MPLEKSLIEPALTRRALRSNSTDPAGLPSTTARASATASNIDSTIVVDSAPLAPLSRREVRRQFTRENAEQRSRNDEGNQPVVSVPASALSKDLPSIASATENRIDSATVTSDVFDMASRLFGSATTETVPSARILRNSGSTVAVGQQSGATSKTAGRAASFSLRKVATTCVTAGAMALAGLIAVSMTLPQQAVAAAQGSPLASASLLVANEGTSSIKVAKDEIQAFVAPTSVHNESLAGPAGFSAISRADLAAEQGIRYSDSLYTNDPTASIQWPYVVGVAMSSPFGQRWGRLHAGIDLVPGDGAPIQAIADGVVRLATESDGGYGVAVYIDHVIDGSPITSHYAHMQYGSLRVATGDVIKVGDILGSTGNTGNSYGAHLHFELLVNEVPIDPLPWMLEHAGRK